MFLTDSIDGSSLPAGHLCLTFDDGPGPFTESIGRYLHSEGIRSTFFVVGKFSIANTGTLAALRELGHLVGNHTYDHPDLPFFWLAMGDSSAQVIRTQEVLRSVIDDEVIFFRAPYGKWSGEVARELNGDLQSSVDTVGPIHWDVAGIDCHYWRNDLSMDDAVDEYLKSIRQAGKGIVVFHDDTADMDFVRPKHRTLELLQRLIPVLKEQGYHFVNLTDIPAVGEAMRLRQTGLLKLGQGTWLAAGAGPARQLVCVKDRSKATVWSFVRAPAGKMSISTADGYALNAMQPAEENSGLELIDSHGAQAFDLIPFSGGGLMLRAHSGNFIRRVNGGHFRANAPYMRLGTIFRFDPVVAKLPKERLSTRLRRLGRAASYIYSKVTSA